MRDQVLLERLPPQDIPTERAVLGCILLEGAAAWSRVGARLETDDFYLDRHRRLWATYRDLVADGSVVDLVTVFSALRDHADDLGIAPAQWLAELAEEASTLTALPDYAALVLRESARRRMIAQASALLDRAYNATLDPAAVATSAAAIFLDIASRAKREAPKPPMTAQPLREVVDDVLATLEAGHSAELVSLGYPGLDRCLGGGLAAGELMYLGARPGVGKTSLALEIARHVARHGRSVLIVSQEMLRAALARRMMAQEAQVNGLSLRQGRLGGGEWVLLRSALPALRALPVWLADDAESVEEIAGLVRRFDASPVLGLVIVDYLQLVRAPREIRERRLQVDAISQGLKSLAVTARVPVLCLSSLARARDGDKTTKPTMSDLRESGELEHDADVILLLHRPPMEQKTEAIMAKVRDGAVRIIELTFHPDTVRFTEPSERRDP